MLRALLILSCAISVLRSAGQGFYYTAPLDLAESFPANSTVCYGDEWYRFPTHFLIPPSTRVGWIKDNFAGSLPIPFGLEHPTPGFNTMNKRPPDWVFLKQRECHYHVRVVPTADIQEHDKANCRRLLSPLTPSWARLVWIPNWPYDAHIWNHLCLIRSKYALPT